MEQLQTVLAVVKKYHFWLLAVVVLLVSLVVYNMAVGALQDQYKSRKSKIESALRSAQSVSSEQDHPNEKKIENWKKLHNEQATKVLSSWEFLYRKQEKQNPWPSVLSEGFRAWLKKYKEEPDRVIPKEYREEYQNFIEQQLPNLFELVNYRHEVEDEEGQPTGAVVGAGDTSNTQGKMVGVVEWAEADREEIMKQYDFAKRPSSTRIRLAQEDYWVYQALLNIIKETNGDATTHSAAAVKAIEMLKIGQEAVKEIQSDRSGQFIDTGVRNADMNLGLGGGDLMGIGPAADPMAAPGQGGDGTLSEGDMMWLENRYVKESLEPLPAGEHEYAEFKMMPIVMKLRIDQRKIPELLVECANSKMPVEVRRLCINPGTGSTTLSLRAGAGGGGGGGPMGHSPVMGGAGGFQDAIGGGGGGRRGRAATIMEGQGNEENPYDVSIVLHGIIYLYNLPDRTKLATGTFADEQPTDATATPDAAAPTDGTTPPASDTTPADTTTPPAPTVPAETPGPLPGPTPSALPATTPATPAAPGPADTPAPPGP